MARASEQAGILEGHNPAKFDPKNPVVLFTIQAGIIIIFTRLLHYPLSRIRQPRVISEVIGGILLGPSVFGRVPGFTAAIFPTDAMPVLNMAANIGLILYLFLVGLEVDLRLMLANWRTAAAVGVAGMLLPFGLGCGIAYGLYHEFREEPGMAPISFGTYMLFVGVAMAITAFPVLCRILTELKLLGTQVGVVTLSAGVGNDVVGWILLALSVALVNAGSGITALYVLLTCIAFILFLIYAVRPPFIWVLRKTGSLQNGPTQSMVALTILLVLASSFFTAIIGVHAIFGAFLMGLICPHEGGFAVKLTEKVEDLVTVFLLPLYFALSGLSTNIGLLDSGITWAYVVGVIAIAFSGKMVGGTLAARWRKMLWRESFTVGALMSCKGLVELIVLNIGLQAQILSVRTFTIFVVMALATTFATTPLVSYLFPPTYQKKVAAWKRGEIDWDGKPLKPSNSDESAAPGAEKQPGNEIRKLVVALRLDSLPSIFTFIDLLGGEKPASSTTKVHPTLDGKLDPANSNKTREPISRRRPLQVHGLRMFELTERLSSVMQESETLEYSARDPVLNAFHTFGQLHNVAVASTIKLGPEDSYADSLASHAEATHSDMILLPWSDTGSMSEIVNNPNPGFLDSTGTPFGHVAYNQFVEKLLDMAPCSTALFINKGFGATKRSTADEPYAQLSRRPSLMSLTDAPTAPLQDRGHHIFLPFLGGRDDHIALRFVLRLAQNPNVTATILHVQPKDTGDSAASSMLQNPKEEQSKVEEGAVVRVSDVGASQDVAFFETTRDSLPEEMRSRIVFATAVAGTDVVARAKDEVGVQGRKAGDLVVVGRRKGRGGGGGGGDASGIAHTLGALAARVLGGDVKASLLVVQASAGWSG